VSARRAATAVVALSLAVPGWSLAQGIGDTAAKQRAARERARQQEAGRKAEPSRVFTNDDLAAGRPPGQAAGGESSAPAEASAAPAEAAPVTGSDAALPSQRLRAELDAASSAKARVAGLEARLREVGAKLNPMSTSFIYGAGGSGSATEEAEVRSELRQLEADLGEARQELARATEALEDASRRQSVPLPPE
jgi:hypothetical protein